MKAIVQRVRGTTRIEFGGAVKTFEGPGLVVLLGWERVDQDRADLDRAEEWIRSRVLGLRVFPDPAGKMNLSLPDYLTSEAGAGGILWVSQFTLNASLESGFRPSFTDAMAPDRARERWDGFVASCRKSIPALIKPVFGEFGADMSLTFTNWGPVTVPLKA